jgi:hypothetical protein
MFKKIAFAFAALALIAGSANAGAVNGSASLGSLNVKNADTNDVTTLTTFNLTKAFADISAGTNGDFNSVEGNFGGSPYTLGTLVGVTFTNGGLSFSNAALGAFVSSSVIQISSTSGLNAQVAYYFLGTYTPGSDVTASNFDAAAQAASVTVSLTQTGGVGKTISFSGTLNTPPASIGTPEPATFVALASGLGVVAFARLRRKSA